MQNYSRISEVADNLFELFFYNIRTMKQFYLVTSDKLWPCMRYYLINSSIVSNFVLPLCKKILSIYSMLINPNTNSDCK